MSVSTTEPPGGTPAAGGLPAPVSRSSTVTISERAGDRVTVSTWDTCPWVAELVAGLLGEPGSRVEEPRG